MTLEAPVPYEESWNARPRTELIIESQTSLIIQKVLGKVHWAAGIDYLQNLDEERWIDRKASEQLKVASQIVFDRALMDQPLDGIVDDPIVARVDDRPVKAVQVEVSHEWQDLRPEIVSFTDQIYLDHKGQTLCLEIITDAQGEITGERLYPAEIADDPAWTRRDKAIVAYDIVRPRGGESQIRLLVNDYQKAIGDYQVVKTTEYLSSGEKFNPTAKEIRGVKTDRTAPTEFNIQLLPHLHAVMVNWTEAHQAGWTSFQEILDCSDEYYFFSQIWSEGDSQDEFFETIMNQIGSEYFASERDLYFSYLGGIQMEHDLYGNVTKVRLADVDMRQYRAQLFANTTPGDSGSMAIAYMPDEYPEKDIILVACLDTNLALESIMLHRRREIDIPYQLMTSFMLGNQQVGPGFSTDMNLRGARH